MIEGRTGRSTHPTSRSDNCCPSPNCGADTETRLFRDSTRDPGFTEPTDKTSLMPENSRPRFGEDRAKRVTRGLSHLIGNKT